MPDEKPAHSLDKFILRLPDGMRDRIAAAAKRTGRSMNSEIVQRLAYTFEMEDRLVAEEKQLASGGIDVIAEAEDAIARLHAVISELKAKAQNDEPPPPSPPRKGKRALDLD